MDIKQTASQAKQASIQLAALSESTKNAALQNIVKFLRHNAEKIFQANQKDLDEAKKNNLAPPLLKRLKFDEEKLESVIEGITALIKIPDPTGQTLSATELGKDLELYKVSCPIGVIGVIFESRPDALVQISTLCLKSGNAVMLKGGSEAINTNIILAETISAASIEARCPQGWIQLLQTRQNVQNMLALDEYIDLIIPRGSNELVRSIMGNTRIAVLGHADGICHVYIDSAADLDMALNIAADSKTQYVAVCNAAETLLVHNDIAADFLPKFKQIMDEKNVELRGCEKTIDIIDCVKADESDWSAEYLDYILSIKTVDSLKSAVEHINKFGSGHTDSIVTADKDTARKFMDLVDSADVFWNASTRFSDGYRYGLGAEVGISTNKIHARGPVGLEGLLIYKYKLIGKGHTVEQYSAGKNKFTHKPLNKKFTI